MFIEKYSQMKSIIFSVATIYITCIVMLSGCASMDSTKEELQTVGENEGVVFGSFVINVAEGEEKESGWAFLKGQKAGDASYEVSISESGFNPFKPIYRIKAIPEKEEIFIKKLPVGNYHIDQIQKLGFTNLVMNLKVNFRVTSKRTTYIGKLIVQFPDRIRPGSPVRMKVADTQQETIEALKTEHEKLLSEVTKKLMTIQR